MGCVILNKMHPIGQVLNYDEQNGFQSRGPKHLHVPVHVKYAQKIDESPDSEVTEFIDRYITFAIRDKDFYPKLYKLLTTVQNHKHTLICHKENGLTCRFGAPWASSETTRIFHVEEIDKTKIASSKKILDKVHLQVLKIDNLSIVTLPETFGICSVSIYHYSNAAADTQKRLKIIYKRKPAEINTVQYNTIILKFLKS